MWFDDDRLTLANYRRGRALRCPAEWAGVLAGCAQAVRREVLIERMAAMGARDPATVVEALVRNRILHLVGSENETDDTTWAARWKWGATAGAFHYATRDIPWLHGDAETDRLRAIADEGGEPPLWETHAGDVDTISLPSAPSRAFLRTAHQRYTCRSFLDVPLSMATLSACLYAGVGFRGFLELKFRPVLPLTMTPSGGGRNPFEAYVVARRVSGVAPGPYHYSGAEHSLRPCDPSQMVPFSSYLGGQEWADDAAAVVILVAHLGRPMHKYRLPSAYGSVLIEAGHIAQNIVLAATEARIGSATTAAIDHSRAEQAVGVRDPLSAAVYAVVLGHPAEADPAVPIGEVGGVA